MIAYIFNACDFVLFSITTYFHFGGYFQPRYHPKDKQPIGSGKLRPVCPFHSTASVFMKRSDAGFHNILFDGKPGGVLYLFGCDYIDKRICNARLRIVFQKTKNIATMRVCGDMLPPREPPCNRKTA